MRNNSKTDKVRRGQRTKNSTNSAFIGDGCLVGAAGLRHDQHQVVLLLLPCCCCVRVRGVCGFSLDFLYRPAFERCVPFFLLFRIAPGGQKPRNFFQKTPRYRGKRPGASFFVFFHMQNRTAPGAFTRIITVSAVSTFVIIIIAPRPLSPDDTFSPHLW